VIFARFLAPLLIGTTMIVGVYLLDWFPDWGGLKKYGLVAGSLIGSYKAPDIFLKNKITKRSHGIRKGLPDAIDLLVICADGRADGGRSIQPRVAGLGRAYPSLATSSRYLHRAGFLNERRTAFENLASRIDLDAVRGVVTTMIQTEKYGTPLASALRVLSAEFRNERMMRAEEKAARLPAIMTVPLIFFILPVLFIVILGPAACSISDKFINA
jgi:tight adherence protein C